MPSRKPTCRKARRITVPVYERLVEAFRDKPGNVSNAARLAGCGNLMASRAWEKGWEPLSLLPIKDVIKEEQLIARGQIEAARLAAASSKRQERENARKNALETRQQEGQMVKLTRGNAMQALAVSVELGRSTRQFSETIQARLTLEQEKVAAWVAYERDRMAGNKPTPPDYARPPMGPEELVNLLNRAADYMAKITQCARQAMEMERLYLGQPTDIVQLADAKALADVSRDELQVRMEAAIAAVSALKQRESVHSLSAGQETPTIGRRVLVK